MSMYIKPVHEVYTIMLLCRLASAYSPHHRPQPEHTLHKLSGNYYKVVRIEHCGVNQGCAKWICVKSVDCRLLVLLTFLIIGRKKYSWFFQLRTPNWFIFFLQVGTGLPPGVST